MNYRERMKDYLKEPDEYSPQYGKWGILNKEQRDLIKRLLREMDSADEVIKHQFFEIERLNKIRQQVIDELFDLKDMIYKPETREINFDVQNKISSIIKILGSDKEC